MPSVGPQYAGSGSNVTGLGSVAWTSTGNVTSDDNASASCAFGSGSGASSNWLYASNFDFSSIPAGATIDGIEVVYGISATIGNRCSDTDANLTKNGTAVVGTDKATATQVTTTEVARTLGGAADLWGTTWTLAEIQSASFGFMIRLLQGTGSTTANIDYVRITVYYTAGATNHALTATVTAAGTITATKLNLDRPLTGTISSAGAVAGTLTKTQAVTATITAVSAIAGTLERVFLLTGTITAASAITGTLLLTHQITGIVTALSAILGTLAADFAGAGTVASAASIGGALGVDRGLTGGLTNSCSITGTLSVSASGGTRTPGTAGDSNLCQLPP